MPSVDTPVVMKMDHSVDTTMGAMIGLQSHVDVAKRLFSVAEHEVNIPFKQDHLVRVLSHQFCLYQRVAEALYVSRKQDVILAFVAEVKKDKSSSKPSWRSSYIDFHFALAIQDNAFVEPKQKAAMKIMRRTWKDFQGKKPYAPLERFDAIELHREFCINGVNMCGNMGGGVFHHTKEVDAMVQEVVDRHAHGSHVPVKLEPAERQPSFDGAGSDIEEIEAIDEPTTPQVAAKGQKRTGRTSGQTGQAAAQQGRARPGHVGITPEDEGDETHALAMQYKGKQDGHKVSRSHDVDKGAKRRSKGKGKTRSKGKGRAMHVVESESDSRGEHASGMAIDDTVEESAMNTDESGPILPTDLPQWDTLNRLAFERGHAGTFVKLGTWLLARTRQLEGADVNAGIDGMLIPGYPNADKLASDDDYYEALGMDRLYTAVVNMEARPAYLSHLFHALGKSCASTKIGTSHPGLRPLLELPSVTRGVAAGRKLRWLTASVEHDSDQASDSDDIQVVRDSAIAANTDMQVYCGVSDDNLKRKRSLSSAKSPPKKDGGRAGAKKSKPQVRLLLPAFDTARVGTSTHPGTLAPVPQSPDTSGMDVDMEDEIVLPMDAVDEPHPPSIAPDMVTPRSPPPTAGTANPDAVLGRGIAAPDVACTGSSDCTTPNSPARADDKTTGTGNQDHPEMSE